MNLPQRKKTAEELAKLRESLGIPDAVPPAAAPRWSPDPPPAQPGPAAAEPAGGAEPPPDEPKPVRSLRKSEQHPLPARRPPPTAGVPAGEAKLPTRRRSDRELNELRRHAAMETRPPIAHLQSITAHPVLLGIGYLLALAGGVGGLLVAAFIFRKKPRSTHHAGFIAVIALFVIVFGALYLFPQLRHAS